jgi:flagellar biosynthesis/type III secretory pathway chaperone
MSGIYFIKCDNEVIYVGESMDIHSRKKQHLEIIDNYKNKIIRNECQVFMYYILSKAKTITIDVIEYTEHHRKKEPKHIKYHAKNSNLLNITHTKNNLSNCIDYWEKSFNYYKKKYNFTREEEEIFNRQMDLLSYWSFTGSYHNLLNNNLQNFLKKIENLY